MSATTRTVSHWGGHLHSSGRGRKLGVCKMAGRVSRERRRCHAIPGTRGDDRDAKAHVGQQGFCLQSSDATFGFTAGWFLLPFT